MSATYWSYGSESAVYADEPPTCTCIRCREEFYQRSATEDTYCDECEAVVERQHSNGKEQPR